MTLEEYMEKPWLMKQEIANLKSRIMNSLGLIDITIKQSKGKVPDFILDKVTETKEQILVKFGKLSDDISVFEKDLITNPSKHSPDKTHELHEGYHDDLYEIFKYIRALSNTVSHQLALNS